MSFLPLRAGLLSRVACAVTLCALGCGEPDEIGQSPVGCASLDLTPHVLWTHTAREAIRSSPTIDAEGFIYYGDERGFMYKLSPDGGQVQWEFDCCVDGPTPEVEPGVGQQCNIDSTAAIDADGRLWFGCWNGALNKVRRDTGERLCLHAAGDEVSSSPALGFDGTVYVGSEDRKFWAVNPDDCSVKWSKDFPGGAVYAAPAVSQHDLIINTSADDHIYAWTPAGELAWRVKTGFDVQSSPALDSDGTIYVGSADHHLYALTPSGGIKWTFEAQDRIYSSVVISADGTLYFGSSDGHLYALDRDGREKWRFATSDRILSTPVLGCDGTIYVGSFDDHLYAVRPDGTAAWTIELDGDVFGPPTLDDKGVLYVGTHAGTLWAIQTQSPGLSNGPWSQYKGGRWRRANQCGDNADSCPCAQGDGSCVLETCNGVDDDLDGQTDEEGACDPCPPGTCVDTATASASCESGQCVLTCTAGFEGEDCTRPVPSPIDSPGSIEWVVSTQDSVATTAAVDDAGNIYIGSGDYTLYKLSANGDVACTYEGAVYRVDSPPLITSAGEIWFGAEDEQLHGIDSNCNALCGDADSLFTNGNILGQPAELSGGDLVFTSGDGNVYRVGRGKGACERQSLIDLDATITSGPVVGPGDALYVGSWAGLHGIAPGGDGSWHYADSGPIVGRPALHQGTLYAGSKSGALLAVSTDGTLMWRTELPAPVWASPRVGSDGTIYVGAFDGQFRAFDSDGKVVWVFKAGGAIRGAAALQGDALYFGADDGFVYAIDRDGNEAWRTHTGAALRRSSPALTNDGRLVIGNTAGHVLSLRR